jgi:Uri superfamily endonuclease
MKGSYVLIIELNNDKYIQIGSIGKIYLKKGFYAYIGSALNGIDQRIKRHVRKNKKVHWHIDFLLKNANVVDVFYKESDVRKECDIAKIFYENFLIIPKFGCSDCKCKSHLFFGELFHFRDIVTSINMKKYVLNANT